MYRKGDCSVIQLPDVRVIRYLENPAAALTCIRDHCPRTFVSGTSPANRTRPLAYLMITIQAPRSPKMRATEHKVAWFCALFAFQFFQYANTTPFLFSSSNSSSLLLCGQGHIFSLRSPRLSLPQLCKPSSFRFSHPSSVVPYALLTRPPFALFDLEGWSPEVSRKGVSYQYIWYHR